MRLLVTRPEPDAMRTAARLGLDGHEALVMPLITIEFMPHPGDLDPAALILTSRNGVRALQRWPQAVDWRHLPTFAVGDATGAAAAEAGFADIRSASGTAEALAALVMEDIEPGIGTIFYPAGRDRTGKVETILAAHGYDLAVVDAYAAHAVERIDPAVGKRLREGSIDGILFYSARTAAIFARLVEEEGLAPALSNVIFFALSKEAGAPLEALPGRLAAAAAPNEDAMIALVEAAA